MPESHPDRSRRFAFPRILASLLNFRLLGRPSSSAVILSSRLALFPSFRLLAISDFSALILFLTLWALGFWPLGICWNVNVVHLRPSTFSHGVRWKPLAWLGRGWVLLLFESPAGAWSLVSNLYFFWHDTHFTGTVERCSRLYNQFIC